ncbi:uncharacterized protein BJ212DRAFT_171475 [Suillus subaureus]|uniref:Uncharacterized protein n=1 Tax=Suillus subaureus TaxID=48587 RepID=A0A9P7JDG5_9AGAM|nr:uncharacterized protein BJ212DRAFT_171475 [Suillus subaureus]KAG1816736.1 hypothetical protein BJ212DRAFT_171475 [Suillus subaureus]
METGLLLDIADAPAPKTKGAPRIPAGFFDDTLRETNLHTRLSQSHEPHNHLPPAPRQRTLSPFPSFWRRSKPHGATERDAQFPSRTRNIVSNMMRRRDRSDIEMREPPVVEVPYTAGKPRHYHARKKKSATSSSRPHTTQQSRAHHHRNHHRLLLLQYLPPPSVPRRQLEQPRVLMSPLLDGALALWAGFAACLSRTHTVNHRDAVATPYWLLEQ